MTKDEIKALIAAKIAGQGTNVDAGSVLPTILNGIIDLIPTAQVQADYLQGDSTKIDYVKNRLVFDADAMGLSAGDLLTREQRELYQRASILIYQNRVFQRLETTVAWKFIGANVSSFSGILDGTPIFGFEYVIDRGEFTGGNFVYYNEGAGTFYELEI